MSTVIYSPTEPIRPQIDSLRKGDVFDGQGYVIREGLFLDPDRHDQTVLKNFTIKGVPTGFYNDHRRSLNMVVLENIKFVNCQNGINLYGDELIASGISYKDGVYYGRGDMNAVYFSGRSCRLLKSVLDQRNPTKSGDFNLPHLDLFQHWNINGDIPMWFLIDFEMAECTVYVWHQGALIQNLKSPTPDVIRPTIHNNLFFGTGGDPEGYPFAIELRAVKDGQITNNMFVDFTRTSPIMLRGPRYTGDFNPGPDSTFIGNNLFLNCTDNNMVYDPNGYGYGNVGTSIVENLFDRSTNRLLATIENSYGPSFVQPVLDPIPEPEPEPPLLYATQEELAALTMRVVSLEDAENVTNEELVAMLKDYAKIADLQEHREVIITELEELRKLIDLNNTMIGADRKQITAIIQRLNTAAQEWLDR